MTNTHFDSKESLESHSLWMDLSLPYFPHLKKSINTDVCIVGGGIVGLTNAYALAKEGKSVVVLDQGPIGGEQTLRTTAHLAWALDDRFYELEDLFGIDVAFLASESHFSAINKIEKIIAEENIDCDFERIPGYLFPADEKVEDILDKEFLTVTKLGKEINRLAKAPFPSFDTGRCLEFPGQAQFHITKYLQGLIQAILKYGGNLFSNTHASQFYEEVDTCLVKTESGNEVFCKSLIVATSTPVNNRFFIHTKQSAYRTYAIAANIPSGKVPKGLYWDTGDPYHYVRTQKNFLDPHLDWLIIGGEDHKTGQDSEIQEKYNHLEEWARIRFPQMEEVQYKWSGQVFEPIDFLAFIGKNPGNKNVYIATGDSGNGITYGTIAGMLIPDLILGRKNPWEKIYDPSRKTLSAGSEFIKENINTLAQYRDWLTLGEKKEIDQLQPEEGMVIRQGLEKIAVYKDGNMNLHMNSAFCPHLGGCVRWNPGEKSWDCPCHGSRFSGEGTVITGPAKNNLHPCPIKLKSKRDV